MTVLPSGLRSGLALRGQPVPRQTHERVWRGGSAQEPWWAKSNSIDAADDAADADDDDDDAADVADDAADDAAESFGRRVDLEPETTDRPRPRA